MIGEREYSEFLDLAYDAALDPGQWECVIGRFADLVGADKAWMPSLNLRDGGGDGVVCGIDPARQDAYFRYYASVNPFFTIEAEPADGPWPLLITTDEDYFDKNDFVRTEYYNDFLRPQDIHCAAIVRLCRHGGVETTLNLARPKSRSQFEPDTLRVAARLQGHLARALRLSGKLAVQRQVAGDLVEMLDQTAHGVFLLDAAGRVRHLNREAERLLARNDGLRVVGGRLSTLASGDARRLEGLIARAACPDGQIRTGGSMPLAALDRTAPLSITVAPLRTERLSALGPCVMVCATDLEARLKLPDELLRDLFGLTGAEARVALAIFHGSSLRAVGESLGVSLQTVRNHLARILEKTNTHRQSELVRLMMRALGIGGT